MYVCMYVTLYARVGYVVKSYNGVFFFKHGRPAQPASQPSRPCYSAIMSKLLMPVW
jgi:hypothetical protein